MINIKKATPMWNHIIVTSDRYENDCMLPGGIIDLSRRKGSIKEFQKVVSVGPNANFVKVGDTVELNFMPYGHPVHSQDMNSVNGLSKKTDEIQMEFNIPTIVIDGVEYLFVSDRDVEFIAEIEEVDDDIITIETQVVDTSNNKILN